MVKKAEKKLDLNTVAITTEDATKVRRHITINEKDNGYTIDLSAGSLYKELVEKSLAKTLKMVAAFLKDEITEEGTKEKGEDTSEED